MIFYWQIALVVKANQIFGFKKSKTVFAMLFSKIKYCYKFLCKNEADGSILKFDNTLNLEAVGYNNFPNLLFFDTYSTCTCTGINLRIPEADLGEGPGGPVPLTFGKNRDLFFKITPLIDTRI